MKKALFIMAAALMTMTQCRKQETMPVTPSANTIKMTVTAGSGAKTDINTETGAITWSAGDKLYVSDGTNWLGSLTLVGEGGSAQGTFTGSIAGIDESETTCHFFYLGHDNGMTEPTGTAAVNISFAAQDGTRAGAMKYHTGYGSTDVTVQDGEYAGYVIMDTKIAIAHINFTTDGTMAYTGSVTMGGTGIFNTLSVSPDGSTFTGSGDEGITIGNGGGTTGERYVTLIPTETADVLNVAFTGDATGSMTFAKGIHENKFYGMSEAIAVTLEAAGPTHEYVDLGLSVKWATCNVGASTPEDYGWYFMWGSTTNGGDSNCIWATCPGNGGNSSSDASAFDTWKSSNLTNNVLNSDVDAASVNWGGGWRMPTTGEWQELYDNTTREWTGNYNSTGVAGRIFTSKTDSSKSIFLPAAGYRDGTSVDFVGDICFYWSSLFKSSEPSFAYNLYLTSSYFSPQYISHRCCGCTVRPVFVAR